jgi:hypothetical protein
MAKAALSWDLDEPDDYQDFKMAVNARGMNSALFEMANYIRTEAKHGDYTDDGYDVLDKIRCKFYDILSDNGVDATEL